MSKKTNWSWEGCLSVPGMKGWVERPRKIKVTGYDELGNVREQSLTGTAARVFQHEYDHLDGILYPDRVQKGRHLGPSERAHDCTHCPNNPNVHPDNPQRIHNTNNPPRPTPVPSGSLDHKSMWGEGFPTQLAYMTDQGELAEAAEEDEMQ